MFVDSVDSGDELGAIHLRQRQVNEGEVDGEFLEHLERLFGRCHNAADVEVAGGLEAFVDGFSHARVAFDE